LSISAQNLLFYQKTLYLAGRCTLLFTAGVSNLFFGGPHEQFLKWSWAGLPKSIKPKITTDVAAPFYAEKVIS